MYIVNTSCLANFKTSLCLALKLYNMIVCLCKLQASNYHEFGDSNKACHSTVCSEVLVFVGVLAGLTVLVLFIVLETSPSNE